VPLKTIVLSFRRWAAARQPLSAAFAVVFLLALPPMARAIEEPEYEVVQQHADFEVREYAPYLVAEVVVPGPAEAAGNSGFRILAAYIFGGNQAERRIAMTAPVTQAPVQIDMTAPVTQSATEGGYVVQFTMPRAFTLETLPAPVDSSIRLREVTGGRYAVIRYSGSWSGRNYAEHLGRLQRSVAAAGLQTEGAPVYARYNAPIVPWFMRRNEIWLNVAR